MDNMPDELVLKIMETLHILHLLVFMKTCSRMRRLGKHETRWRAMRVDKQLAAPKPQNRKFKTDFDVVNAFMSKACKQCFNAKAGVGQVCKTCRKSRAYISLDALRTTRHTLCESIKLYGNWIEQHTLRVQILEGELQSQEAIMRRQRLRVLWRFLSNTRYG